MISMLCLEISFPSSLGTFFVLSTLQQAMVWLNFLTLPSGEPDFLCGSSWSQKYVSQDRGPAFWWPFSEVIHPHAFYLFRWSQSPTQVKEEGKQTPLLDGESGMHLEKHVGIKIGVAIDAKHNLTHPEYRCSQRFYSFPTPLFLQ